MSDLFDDLIKEVREAHLKAPRKLLESVIARTDRPRPDAMVLMTMRVTCECCGETYEFPSHHLMLRFGKNFIHTNESVIVFGDLPHEVATKEDTAPRCIKCFGEPVKQYHFD